MAIYTRLAGSWLTGWQINFRYIDLQPRSLLMPYYKLTMFGLFPNTKEIKKEREMAPFTSAYCITLCAAWCNMLHSNALSFIC